MYEEFFGLKDRPFVPVPLAKRYFPAKAAENARQTLARCIERCEGIGLLIGPAGMGKTLLCQVLAEQFRPRLTVAHLPSSRLSSPRSLYQAILFELGFPYRGLEEGELRFSLEEHLTKTESNRDGLLLLVDEAHLLSRRLLEELRLLTNLLRAGQPRVRIVLAGLAALEERLASTKLESFNQRIAARRYLQAFEHDETLAYLEAEVSAAGCDIDRVFTRDALPAIHRATDGIPRVINQLCDHALVMAFAGGVKPVPQAGIEEAWADLQQLPTQWSGGAAEQPPDIIEFGSLDDDVLPLSKTGDKVVTPRLHAVAGGDAELFSGEPGERIEKIEARLNGIDDDFAPATIEMPQVELVFADPGDPFAESFLEEEVIVDRFANLESIAWADRPSVRSAEGRELAALLKPLAGHGDRSDRSHHAAADATAPFSPEDDPVLPDDDNVSQVIASIEYDSPHNTNSGAKLTGEAEIAAMHGDGPALSIGDEEGGTGGDELELIVIEDDPPEPEPPSPKPPKARQQEYRQLFARLRRG